VLQYIISMIYVTTIIVMIGFENKLQRTRQKAEAVMSMQDANTITLRDGAILEFRHSTNDRMSPELAFAEQLRQSIRSSEVTQYGLSKVSGVPQGAISVFLRGGDIQLKTFTRLAHCMGFEFGQNPEKKPKVYRRNPKKS